MQNNLDTRKKLLTIGEASEYLGVSVDTLRRWEKRGRIEPYRSPGGHRHFDKDDLDKLFDKRYTRDEPTIRSSKTEEVVAEFPKENHQEPAPDQNPIPKYTLPSWRALKEEPIEFQENKTLVEVKEDKTNTLERPVREIKIPEVTRIQVTRREALVTPDEAYFRQQSISVLTPPTTGIPVPNNIAVSNAQDNITAKSESSENKLLLIYLSVMASIVLFAIAWYFLWKNSQTILSPVP